MQAIIAGLLTPSSLSLLGVNLGVIYFAVTEHWLLPTILTTYLVQSVIIGVFQIRKMLDLKAFSTEGLKMNDHPVAPVPASKWMIALFFAFHYGIFHAVYALFILTAGRPDWINVMISGGAFFANHLFSYVMNRNRPRKTLPNIGHMMFFPYIRIIPMHAFILTGALTAAPAKGIALFMLLKTLADEAMHAIEHRDEAL